MNNFPYNLIYRQIQGKRPCYIIDIQPDKLLSNNYYITLEYPEVQDPEFRQVRFDARFVDQWTFISEYSGNVYRV